jgi:hypothetical protein
MIDEPDNYEVFLQTWQSSTLLRHASLPQNLEDPYSLERLFVDTSAEADVTRTPFAFGTKIMSEEENIARAYHFFEDHQEKWSKGLRDYVTSAGLPQKKFDLYVEYFSTHWVDGMARRQNSSEMLAVRASVRDFDRDFHRLAAGKYVLNPVPDTIKPLFTPTEMEIIFDANSGLIEAYLSDYVDFLGQAGPSTISGLYIRRGVKMPEVPDHRVELSELSSYSLGIGAVEQFAQLHNRETEHTGVQSIFSAPLPAVQHRVVAFAPFIAGMDLRQLELVVAPPISNTPFLDQGEYGGIHEYGFR